MNCKKIFFIAFFILLCSGFAAADTVWEGTAAMSRHGEFPPRGFFGASGSFPINTIVSVENVRTGNSVEVIIVSSLSNNNLFLLLSQDAADALGMRQDEILPVRAKLPDVARILPTALDNVARVENILSNETTAEDRSAANDSPRRTLIIYTDEFGNNIIAEVLEANASGETAAARAEAMTETSTEEAFMAETAAARAEAMTETSTEEAFMAETAAARAGAMAEASTEAFVAEAAEENMFAGVSAVALTDFHAAASDYEDMSVSENADLLAYLYENAEGEWERRFILRATCLRPPVVDESEAETAAISASRLVPADKAAATHGRTHSGWEPSPGNMARNSNIQIGSYYIQLIAFRDFSSAENAKNSANIDFPIIIHYDARQSLYRVLAGPLKTDERGAALLKARNSGYRDAFIRRSE
ncbi:MAG: SPOR domain-containing protein [Spirochaetes bacterium]|nr:SPOR domain-containing protein [Spirochaetota bacterium]